MKGIHAILLSILVLILILLGFSYKEKTNVEIVEKIKIEKVEPEKLPPQINIPFFLSYTQTIDQIKEWNSAAPDITEYGVYGRSDSGKDIYFIKLGNKDKNNPAVMIAACIHGNEPLASSTVMQYTGNLLKGYGNDETITKLIDNRDIYIIPIASPDSYPNERFIRDIDPNRAFLKNRLSNLECISALQEFAIKIKPKAFLSAHTYGRFFLYPYGDTYRVCPDNQEYINLVNELADKAGYTYKKASAAYKRPIIGSEVDWMYRNGAFSLVMELGTHQEIPTDDDIIKEFNMTWESLKLFIEKAPLVNLKMSN